MQKNFHKLLRDDQNPEECDATKPLFCSAARPILLFITNY